MIRRWMILLVVVAVGLVAWQRLQTGRGVEEERPVLLSFFSQKNPITDATPLPDIYEMMAECFPGAQRTRRNLAETSRYAEIFVLVVRPHGVRLGDYAQYTPVGHVEYYLSSCNNGGQEFATLKMFSVCIARGYRDRGWAPAMISDSIANLRKVYPLPWSTIIGLHLSHRDLCMPYALALYDMLGFTEHTAICDGPDSVCADPTVLFGDAARTLDETLGGIDTLFSENKRTKRSRMNYFCMFRKAEGGEFRFEFPSGLADASFEAKFWRPLSFVFEPTEKQRKRLDEMVRRGKDLQTLLSGGKRLGDSSVC